MPNPPTIGGDVAPPGAVSPYAAAQLRSPSGPPLPGQPGPGFHPAVQRPPAQPRRPRPWWRRKRVVLLATLAVVALAAVVAVVVALA